MGSRVTTQMFGSRVLGVVLAASMALNTVAFAGLLYQVHSAPRHDPVTLACAQIPAPVAPVALVGPIAPVEANEPLSDSATPETQPERHAGADGQVQAQKGAPAGPARSRNSAVRPPAGGAPQPAASPTAISPDPSPLEMAPTLAGESRIHKDLDLAFKKAKLVTQTGDKKRETDILLRLRDGQLRLAHKEGKAPTRVIELHAIRSLTYQPTEHDSILGRIARAAVSVGSGLANAQAPGTGHFVAPLRNLIPQGKSIRHMLTIRTASEEITVRLDRENVEAVLTALDTYSGTRVRVEEEVASFDDRRAAVR